MEVKQIAQFINEATQQMIGEVPLMEENLSNVVDVGTAIFATAQGTDHFVHALPNVIGKWIFVARVYKGAMNSVMKDEFEYGSIVSKIRAELPEATENESWELSDGTVYEQNQFYGAKVHNKFFNKIQTFEIPASITDRQLKESFNSAQQLNSFISMIYTSIENAMTVKNEALIKRTIANFIAETLHDAFPSGGYNNGSKAKAVNLLYLYNATLPEDATALTVEEALTNQDFIRYASKIMKLYMHRMSSMSKVFNIGGTEKFTSADKLHVVLLDEFSTSADMYLQSDVFHNELTKLPTYEATSYWQGSGTDFEFDSVSKVHVTTADGNAVELSGILGVMFDHDALGVYNFNRRTTTHYNAKAEFTNNWFKMDARYFNDYDENFVVFYIA